MPKITKITRHINMPKIFAAGKENSCFYESLYGDVLRVIPFQPFFGQNCWKKKITMDAIMRDLFRSKLQFTGQPRSRGPFSTSRNRGRTLATRLFTGFILRWKHRKPPCRCHVVIKGPIYFQFENVNVMRKNNDKFNSTIHYPYVWYENKVIAKISQ